MRFYQAALGVAIIFAAPGCLAPDETTAESLESEQAELSAIDTPIFITHGLAAWPFDDSLKPHLESLGYTVFMPTVSPFGPVRHRAEELRTQIDAGLDSVGAEKGIVIAHSMGGVDARWLLSPSGLNYDRVAAVVTIASPHRGTAIADTVINGVPLFLQGRVDRLLKAMNLTPDDAASLEGLNDLTTSQMALFNAQVPDNPGVEYYSFSSEQRPVEGLNPVLYVSYYIIKSKEGANDGIASVEGAKWGHYLGHLNADHADHVGGLGINTKFDFRSLYADAIGQALDNFNAGTYAPTFSVATAEHPFPQSEHQYWNNSLDTREYSAPGASSVRVTFDERTRFENGYDYLHVEAADGSPVPGSPFTGTMLAGQTLDVAGDTVHLRMETDFSITDWGYRVTNVEAL